MKCKKIKIALYGLIASFMFLYSCERDEVNLNENETNEQQVDASVMVQGIVRIKLQRTTSKSMNVSLKSGKVKTDISNMDTLFNSIGVTSFKRTFPYAGKFEARTVASGLDLWYDVKYDTTQVRLASVLNRFTNLTEVSISEGVPTVKSTGYKFKSLEKVVEKAAVLKSSSATYPFDDYFLGLQWHYDNDGSLDDAIAGCDINLFAAWKIQTGTADVIVAVVDGGIDVTHEDLADNIWINENESENDLDDDGNGYADDIHGYNFVSNTGTIAAHEHGTHVAGTIGAVNNNGIGVCGIAGGDGTTPGVRLMSCQVFESDENGDDISADNFAAAIKYGADNGAIISQNSWGYDGITTIPTHMKDAIDYFIEYAGVDENGIQVGPMKGGVVIFAAGNEASTIGIPASYEPVVSVAAIAPDYKAAYYTNYGSWVDISAPGGTYDDNGRYQEANYMIASTYPDNSYVWSMGTSMACPHVSGVAALIASEYGGEGFTPTNLKKRLLKGAVDLDSYNPDYVGQLGAGIINAAAALKSETPPENNQAPVISSESGSVFTQKAHETKQFKFTIDDPEGHDVSWNLSDESGYAVASGNDTEALITIVGLTTPAGTYSATITALDEWGGSSTFDFTYTVQENHAPVVIKQFGNTYLGDPGDRYTYYLTEFFTDEDGETLSYSLSYDESMMSASVSYGALTIEPDSYGLSTFTINASDALGETVSLSFQLMIRDDSNEIDLYPTPVVDKLNIRMGESVDGNVNVEIYNSNGVLKDIKSAAISTFSPAQIDMSSLISGTYTLKIKYDTQTFKRNIVKL
nr:S8 family serine peptidase [uncultured Carboxylicivirga sp.]